MTNEEAIKIFKEVREEVIAKETELSRQVFENLGIKAIDVAIKALEQQPKMGKWIDIMVGDMPAQACDRCNTFYPLAYTGGGHKYCPNCGAKMEVEE